MSQDMEETSKAFFELVDRFLGLANELGQDWPRSRISSTLLYAAARYNAFNCLRRDVGTEQTPEAAALYFRDQYEKMFFENLRELAGAVRVPDKAD